MTQIVVTLENDADTTLLRRMIENMKGVIMTSVKADKKSDLDKESDQWLTMLRSIKRDIDPALIDMNDERTKYLMGK